MHKFDAAMVVRTDGMDELKGIWVKYGVFLALDQADVPVGRRQQSRRRVAPAEVREVVVGIGNKVEVVG